MLFKIGHLKTYQSLVKKQKTNKKQKQKLKQNKTNKQQTKNKNKNKTIITDYDQKKAYHSVLQW